MKKTLSMALIIGMLATSMSANEIALNTNQTVKTQEVTLESIMAAPDDPNATITPPAIEHRVEKEGDSSLGMKIAGAVFAPVYVAGMVATAIVVAPVWLVKKAFGE